MDAPRPASNAFYDAFISYGRIDSKQFATRLYQHLLNQGFGVWFDQNDIPLGVDFQAQIDKGLEYTNNFLFIITPHAVNSPYCAKEISAALQWNKRIIPLLYMEEISRETWQTRHPEGTDAEWAEYQAQGLHSSFPNMHPEVAKINWVYFREGIEDFETSCAKLTAVFDHHRDYVQKHTTFLVQALNWERRQKQPSYLLTGEEYQAAEDWLKLQFQSEPLPCLPTDLHCEYITESIKNANNWMTQVFLAYADEDREISDQIRCRLMREGLTVWMNRTDIRTGEDFKQAIKQGIEEADNLIYLISPAALRSPACQSEINYALSLNKRVISVLIHSVKPDEIPSALRDRQYLDLTADQTVADYQQNQNQLIKTLRDNPAYFEQHKVILAKALKWKRQHQNPSLLLRGYNLQHAEAWLRGTETNRKYPPTPLQIEFIQTSVKQPQERSLDVFIAYSRVDSDFARRLNDALQNQGKTTWFDQESIASGVDFQQEILHGIEMSNNVLFLLSPSSIQSPYCIDEVEYAQHLNKRIVPVLYRPINATDLPASLAKIQWVDFNDHNGDFFTNFGELVRTLDTDREYKRSHTRLLVQAREWEHQKKDPSFLLRGKELKDAEQWLKTAAAKQPQATPLQRRYITTSRRSPLRKPSLRTAGLAGLGAGLLVLTSQLLGWLQPLELAAYDRFMRWKPSEPKDPRLLLIEITDEDIKTQNIAYPIGVRGGSLADPALARLLDLLEAARPQVIGLDVYRDFRTDQPNLATQFERNPNLIVVCKLRSDIQGEEAVGIYPPRELPPEQFSKRLGFSDLSTDSETVVRRQLLVDTPTPPECDTESSFSLAIARHYLEAQGKPFRPPFTPDGKWIQPLQLGSTTVPRLMPYNAAYFNSNAPIGRGYQTMINYRNYQGDFNRFIERRRLQDVLNYKVPVDQIRDRIVLIGFTSKSGVNDYSLTPVGEMAGVLIQAQMVSQLTSAVLDGRPLIWWWSFWENGLWIMGWAFLGSAIVWAFQRPQRLASVGTLVFISVGLIGYTVFVFYSGWLPVVPAAIALVTAGGITLAVTNGLR